VSSPASTLELIATLPRCDVIAQGIINAAANLGLKKPVIVRLKGTNFAAGKALIEVYSLSPSDCLCHLFPPFLPYLLNQNSGLKMIVSDDFADAAGKAVTIANIVKQAEESNLHVDFSFAS
jgi:succinyl-CoA synthetase beta subunit